MCTCEDIPPNYTNGCREPANVHEYGEITIYETFMFGGGIETVMMHETDITLEDVKHSEMMAVAIEHYEHASMIKNLKPLLFGDNN